jgi:hypothetical protein
VVAVFHWKPHVVFAISLGWPRYPSPSSSLVAWAMGVIQREVNSKRADIPAEKARGKASRHYERGVRYNAENRVVLAIK